ncbi:PREDICTED: uncharacterized protein LOC106104055 [Papilio polytes]|uniref:uncharacterized protein LOC106104055 n=1 Tax=Papilio polytes TaxID=76194 RepID=UPI000675E0B3|nr:PREDICTED: uncharacterized protein LOC106104055 [Papilio polytes]
MEEKWSYFSLKPHLRNLRYGGYCALDPIPDVRNDMNTLMDTMFLLFTYFGSIYKQIVMISKADDVQALLNTMKGDLFNQPEEMHYKLLIGTAREAKILVNTYSLAAFVNGILMGFHLLILYLQGKPVEFCIWFPFELDTKLKFSFALFYYYIQVSWIAVNITTLDAFITSFLHQCTAQINILRNSQIDKTSLAFMTIIIFLMCIFAELFLFCFYGSRLTDASIKLMDSAYFLDWVEIPMQHRKNLMLFMEMIKKPIMPTAGSIAPLANTTFVSIVKSSYSFYAFLKNTEN